MPLIDDILDNVGECKYLSKLDLSKGFYQVPIKESDKDKTAFCTPFGKFRFLRMPFGLMNAPSTFQRMMQTVLECQENYSSPYNIDDVLIYSRTWKEHVEHIRQVLGKFCSASFCALISMTFALQSLCLPMSLAFLCKSINKLSSTPAPIKAPTLNNLSGTTATTRTKPMSPTVGLGF